MIVCIPSMDEGGLDDLVCDHFGRAPTFTVVDTESKQVRVVRNMSEHMGGSGKPPEQIASTGANVVLCSGLGPRAIAMLATLGIEVFVGASGTVRDAIEMWTNGRLEPGSELTACREHRH